MTSSITQLPEVSLMQAFRQLESAVESLLRGESPARQTTLITTGLFRQMERLFHRVPPCDLVNVYVPRLVDLRDRLKATLPPEESGEEPDFHITTACGVKGIHGLILVAQAVRISRDAEAQRREGWYIRPALSVE